MTETVVPVDPALNPFLIDPDTLTLGEYAAIWELTGWSTAEIIAAFATGAIVNHPPAVLALQLIVGKRASGKSYTLVDAGAVRLIDLDIPDEHFAHLEDDVAAAITAPPDDDAGTA